MYFARARARACIRTCRWKKRQVHVKKTWGLAAPHRKNKLNAEIKQIEHRKQTMPRKFHTAGTFFLKTPGIFYVFLSGNVCFRLGKRTFPGRETYVSRTGNIENLNAVKHYLTGISSIWNA